MDCYCDYEPAVFYNKHLRRARKSYRCEECGGPIAAGERYEFVSALWKDVSDCPDTFRTCIRCVALRDWVTGNIPCFCWRHGNMLDDAHDAIEWARERAPEETVGLSFGFLRRLHSIRNHRPAMAS